MLKTIKRLFFISISLSLGGITAQECNTIIDVDFNNWNDRRYSIEDVKEDFNNKIKPWTASTYRGIERPGASNNLIEGTPQETRIVDGNLRAEYLKNDASGRSGGFLFDSYFDGVEEAYLEYKLKFDDNFFWATGGKLPGLGGSTEGINSETQGRGTIPSGKRYNETGTGFSARLMWRRNRTQTNNPYLILYSYFAKKQDNTARRDNQNGDAYRIFSDLEDDKWYTIKQYIKLNTPGRDNGTVKMWVDGNLVMNDTQMNIRKTSNRNLKINALIMNTYRGGSRTDNVWHSPRTEYIFFDDFKVWTNCSDLTTTSDENERPTITLNKPVSSSVFELGETIELDATASDPDGNLEKVNFKINDDFYRQDQTRPFKTTFTPQREGIYVISAKAFDSEGLASEKSVIITVNAPAPANQRPTITITSPTNQSIIELGDTIELNTTASDPNGNLDKVNFKINDDFYRQDQTRPFKTTFTPQREGSYIISAKVFDTEGLSSEKSVTITVVVPTPENQRPTVTINGPLNNSVYELGDTIELNATASDLDNNFEKLNFKINDQFYRTSDRQNFVTSFRPTNTGTYIVSAKAFDSEGLAIEKSVSITVVNAGNNEPSDNDNTNSCNFNTPISRGLPSFSRASFNNIHILGNGGPNVDEIRRFKINWDAATNKLHQFAVNTKNGIPTFYVNLLTNMTFNFNSPNPQLTITNSGLNGWDGSYWVTNDGENFVMVSKNNNFSLYFNNGSAPNCEGLSNKFSSHGDLFSNIKVYPSPATTFINVTGVLNETPVSIIDITGRIIVKTTINQSDSRIDVSQFEKGVYFLKLYNGSILKTITFIKN